MSSFFQQSPHQLWEVLVPEAQDRHRRRLSRGGAAPLMVVASVFPDPVVQGRCLSFVSGVKFCKRTLHPDPTPVSWTLDVGCFADIFTFVLSISYCPLRPL